MSESCQNTSGSHPRAPPKQNLSPGTAASVWHEAIRLFTFVFLPDVLVGLHVVLLLGQPLTRIDARRWHDFTDTEREFLPPSKYLLNFPLGTARAHSDTHSHTPFF